MHSNDFAPSAQRLQSTPRKRAGRGLTVLLVLPAAVLLLTPFGLVAVAAAAQPDMLLILVERPLAAAQLTAGLVISLMFCLLPFSRIGSGPNPTRREPEDTNVPR